MSNNHSARDLIRSVTTNFTDQHIALARQNLTPSRVYVGKELWALITEGAKQMAAYQTATRFRRLAFMGLPVFIVENDNHHFHVSP